MSAVESERPSNLIEETLKTRAQQLNGGHNGDRNESGDQGVLESGDRLFALGELLCGGYVVAHRPPRLRDGRRYS